MNGKRKVNFIYSVCLFTAVWTINLFALDAHGLGILTEYVMGDASATGLGYYGSALIGDVNGDGIKDVIAGHAEEGTNEEGTLVITPLTAAGDFDMSKDQVLASPFAAEKGFGRSVKVLEEVNQGGSGRIVTAAGIDGTIRFMTLSASAGGLVSIDAYFSLDTAKAELANRGWYSKGFGHSVELIERNGDEYILAIGSRKGDKVVIARVDYSTASVSVLTVVDGMNTGFNGEVESGDRFGYSVALVNNNGDATGFTLAVVSPFANGYYGELLLLKFNADYSINAVTELKTADMPLGFTADYEVFSSVTSCDLDSSGTLDLLIGSVGYTPTNLNPSVNYAGAVNVIFLEKDNSMTGVYPIYKGSLAGLVDSNSVVSESGLYYYGYELGSTVHTGDYNNDGMTDFLVGAAAHGDYGGVWLFGMKAKPSHRLNIDTLTLSASGQTWETKLDLDTIFSGNKPEYHIINTYDTTIAQCMIAANLLKCKPGTGADKIQLVVEASDTTDPSGVTAYSTIDSMVVKVIVGNSLPVSLLPDTLYLQEEFSDTLLNLSQYFTDTDSLSYTEKIIDDVLFTNSLVGTTITLKSLRNRAGISRLELGADDGISTTFDTVYISIENIQDPPVAVDDSLTMAEDGSEQTLDVLTNDFDVDARDTLSLCDTLMAHNGAKASVFSGLLNYQPAADFFGKDSVKYCITDGLDSTWAWVRVEVTPINDLPRLQNPIGTLTLDVDSGTVYVPLDSVFAEVDWDKGGSMTLASECDDYADVFRELLHHGDLSITPLRSFTGSCKIILNFQGDVAGEFARDTLSLFIKKESSSVAVNAAEKLLRGAGNNQNLIDAENGTLFLSPSASGRIVRVYDVFGREFLQKSISEKSESIHLSPGIWLVRVEGINQTVKVVVGQYGTF